MTTAECELLTARCSSGSFTNPPHSELPAHPIDRGQNPPGLRNGVELPLHSLSKRIQGIHDVTNKLNDGL